MKRQIKYSKEKVLGVLFGTFIGDALGRPLEGAVTSDEGAIVERIEKIDSPLLYTDDTQMAISVFEEMAEHGRIDKESLKNRFLNRFDPSRGYGAGIFTLIKEWENGTDLDTAAESLFNGEGSFGNGAAMRVAPVSLFFSINQLRELFETVKHSAEVTHTHILGIHGAQFQALAVLFALNDIPESQWIHRYTELAFDDIYRIELGFVQTCLKQNYSIFEAVDKIGNSIMAHEAVPAALFAFLRKPGSFRETIISALCLGGDSDTIAAMAGAIAGAKFGIKGIPEEWLNTLENKKEGKDFITTMVDKCY